MTQIRDDFTKTGYTIGHASLTTAELDLMREVCETLLAEPAEDGGEGKHTIGLGQRRRFLAHRHEEFPALENCLLHGTPARIAAEILGGSAFLFNEQFVVKGARKGASFAWHQDGAYVGFDHKPYVTIWIALDAATVDNGCVYILPRDLRTEAHLDPHQWQEESNELNGYFGDEPGTPVECPAGSVVAFSSLTLHRSGENVTDAPRRAFIAQYSPEVIIDPATGAPKRYAKPVG
jgi:ectoine hydroxylase-related dioxygenase (phytanoyl-CoA dioxygenase family)